MRRCVNFEELNHRELERYVRRVSDRWPLDRALLGGARVADLRGAGAQRERGPEYVIVLVSEHFDGVPWLERVYVTGTLWDAYEMGAPADMHAYTPAEFERKREALPAVRDAAEWGLELLARTRVALRTFFAGRRVTPGDTRVSQGHADSFAVLRPAAHPVRRATGRARARRARAGVRGDRRALSRGAAAGRAALSARGAGRGRAAAGVLAAWSALQRGDEVRDLRAWLYRIVHNTALNQLRVGGLRLRGARGRAARPEAPQEEMERRAVVRQTLTGLAALPERQREALLRSRVEGRSQRGRSRATRRHRGRGRLGRRRERRGRDAASIPRAGRRRRPAQDPPRLARPSSSGRRRSVHASPTRPRGARRRRGSSAAVESRAERSAGSRPSGAPRVRRAAARARPRRRVAAATASEMGAPGATACTTPASWTNPRRPTPATPRRTATRSPPPTTR